MSEHRSHYIIHRKTEEWIGEQFGLKKKDKAESIPVPQDPHPVDRIQQPGLSHYHTQTLLEGKVIGDSSSPSCGFLEVTSQEGKESAWQDDKLWVALSEGVKLLVPRGLERFRYSMPSWGRYRDLVFNLGQAKAMWFLSSHEPKRLNQRGLEKLSTPTGVPRAKAWRCYSALCDCTAQSPGGERTL